MFKAKDSNKSLFKAVQILKLFNLDTLELSAFDAAQKTGIPLSTSYRLLTNLTKTGLLIRDEKTRKYMVGPVMYFLGILYLKKIDLFRAAEPVIKTLNELTEEAITIATFVEGNLIYTIVEKSPHFLNLNVHVGSVVPAYSSAIGRAFLAELTDTEIDSIYPEEELIPLTKKTISTKRELKQQLKQIRKTGISFNSEGTFEGVDGFGSVIRQADGKATAVLGIALPTIRMNLQNHKLFIGLIKMGSSLISYHLGYKDSVSPVHSIEEIRSWWTQSKLNITTESSKDIGNN